MHLSQFCHCTPLLSTAMHHSPMHNSAKYNSVMHNIVSDACQWTMPLESLVYYGVVYLSVVQRGAFVCICLCICIVFCTLHLSRRMHPGWWWTELSIILRFAERTPLIAWCVEEQPSTDHHNCYKYRYNNGQCKYKTDTHTKQIQIQIQSRAPPPDCLMCWGTTINRPPQLLQIQIR